MSQVLEGAGGPTPELDEDDSRRPRLALIHYSASPVVGGVERVMTAQATMLRGAGYDVRIIAGRGDSDLIPEADSWHPEVERLTCAIADSVDVAEPFQRLRARIRDRLEVLLADRDLVIAHNVMTMPFNLPLAAALVEVGRPLIAWTHDLAWADPQYEAFCRRTWPCCLIATAQPGVTYAAISELRRHQLAELLGLSAADVTLVPNGIDPLDFAEVDRRVRRLLGGLGALDADPLILIPQRVTARKRLELAIDAAARLVDEMPRLRMLVTGPVDPHEIGSGGYASRLLERRDRLGLRDVVGFVFEHARDGEVHPILDADIPKLYLVSDAVLVPSSAEGFGLPLLEAAVARVPVVCSDLAVFREVGGEGPIRFPVDGDGEDVAEALRLALDGRAIGHRRQTMRRFAWARTLEIVERLLSSAHVNGASSALNRGTGTTC
jgi:glycosyltransferase involved in cell wall biosynthesis